MNYSRPWMFAGLALMAAGAVMLWQQQTASPAPRPNRRKTPAADPYCVERPLRRQNPRPAGKRPHFGGEGKVYVKDGAIVMEMGSMMTGITWTGEVLRNNYELELEGMRLDGSDFFCTTTFPVGKDPCSLVVGGWGGGVVGLSSVDYYDASENATTKTHGLQGQPVVSGAHPRDRRRDRGLDRRREDGRPAAQGPQVRHPHGGRPVPPAGHLHLGTAGAVRNIRVRP